VKGGIGLLYWYQGSHIKALTHIYPELEFKKHEFFLMKGLFSRLRTNHRFKIFKFFGQSLLTNFQEKVIMVANGGMQQLERSS
jgi:hypothetical protein